jgi:hypothetical protein
VDCRNEVFAYKLSYGKLLRKHTLTGEFYIHSRLTLPFLNSLLNLIKEFCGQQ